MCVYVASDDTNNQPKPGREGRLSRIMKTVGGGGLENRNNIIKKVRTHTEHMHRYKRYTDKKHAHTHTYSRISLEVFVIAKHPLIHPEGGQSK